MKMLAKIKGKNSTGAVSMHNINQFIASALFNVLHESTHASDILTHCAPMP